jgi:hypothetical protein
VNADAVGSGGTSKPWTGRYGIFNLGPLFGAECNLTESTHVQASAQKERVTLMNILIPSALDLQASDIQKEFIGFLSDMNEEITLDSIDRLEGKRGFKIRSHNAHGVLPDIIVLETGNRYEVLERLDTEIARLMGTIQGRRDSIVPSAEYVVTVAKAGDTLRRAGTGRSLLRVEKNYAS